MVEQAELATGGRPPARLCKELTLYRVLLMAGICLAAARAQAQTYNPTASDANQNTGGGKYSQPSISTGPANSTAENNTGFGYSALDLNYYGSDNTAFGTYALTSVGGTTSATGSANTAVGAQAAASTTSGGWNTAIGASSLGSNTSGSYNTVVGVGTASTSTTGSLNTAVGMLALNSSTTGSYNATLGAYSLLSNTTGNSNTAIGYYTLPNNTTGTQNIALGLEAGYSITTGSNNIDIGNFGNSADNQTIRIGSAQSRTYVAGIYGTNVAGSAVVVNANGQLGVVQSSARYKQDIVDMADESSGLARLRPVAFSYKSDPGHEKRYGLIAEEVDKVFPELVVHNSDGQIESVRYDELAPMLLNELQKQEKLLREQQEQIQILTAKLARLNER